MLRLFLSYVSVFFFSSRRRHTRSKRDWSSDVCSSDLSNKMALSATLKFVGNSGKQKPEKFEGLPADILIDRKSTRLNSSHVSISYAVFCLKKKKKSASISSNARLRTSAIQLPQSTSCQ